MIINWLHLIVSASFGGCMYCMVQAISQECPSHTWNLDGFWLYSFSSSIGWMERGMHSIMYRIGSVTLVLWLLSDLEHQGTPGCSCPAKRHFVCPDPLYHLDWWNTGRLVWTAPPMQNKYPSNTTSQSKRAKIIDFSQQMKFVFFYGYVGRNTRRQQKTHVAELLATTHWENNRRREWRAWTVE